MAVAPFSGPPPGTTSYQFGQPKGAIPSKAPEEINEVKGKPKLLEALQGCKSLRLCKTVCKISRQRDNQMRLLLLTSDYLCLLNTQNFRLKRVNSLSEIEEVIYRRPQASEKGPQRECASRTAIAEFLFVMRDEPPLVVLMPWDCVRIISDSRYFLLEPPAGLQCTESLTLNDFQQRAKSLQGRKSALAKDPRKKLKAIREDPELATNVQRAADRCAEARLGPSDLQVIYPTRTADPTDLGYNAGLHNHVGKCVTHANLRPVSSKQELKEALSKRVRNAVGVNVAALMDSPPEGGEVDLVVKKAPGVSAGLVLSSGMDVLSASGCAAEAGGNKYVGWKVVGCDGRQVARKVDILGKQDRREVTFRLQPPEDHVAPETEEKALPAGDAAGGGGSVAGGTAAGGGSQQPLQDVDEGLFRTDSSGLPLTRRFSPNLPGFDSRHSAGGFGPSPADCFCCAHLDPDLPSARAARGDFVDHGRAPSVSSAAAQPLTMSYQHPKTYASVASPSPSQSRSPARSSVGGSPPRPPVSPRTPLSVASSSLPRPAASVAAGGSQADNADAAVVALLSTLAERQLVTEKALLDAVASSTPAATPSPSPSPPRSSHRRSVTIEEPINPSSPRLLSERRSHRLPKDRYVVPLLPPQMCSEKSLRHPSFRTHKPIPLEERRKQRLLSPAMLG